MSYIYLFWCAAFRLQCDATGDSQSSEHAGKSGTFLLQPSLSNPYSIRYCEWDGSLYPDGNSKEDTCPCALYGNVRPASERLHLSQPCSMASGAYCEALAHGTRCLGQQWFTWVNMCCARALNCMVAHVAPRPSVHQLAAEIPVKESS